MFFFWFFHRFNCNRFRQTAQRTAQRSGFNQSLACGELLQALISCLENAKPFLHTSERRLEFRSLFHPVMACGAKARGSCGFDTRYTRIWRFERIFLWSGLLKVYRREEASSHYRSTDRSCKREVIADVTGLEDVYGIV